MSKGTRQRKDSVNQIQQKTEQPEQINAISGDMDGSQLKALNSFILPTGESNPHILCLGETGG